jgi:N6-adenosine-specific RNA methylase IME4
VADRAGEVRIAADVVIGKKLAEQPRARGAQTIGRNQTLRPINDAPSYAELGIPNRMQAGRFLRIAAVPDAERKAAIAALKADPSAHVTNSAVLRIVTKAAQHAHREEIRRRPEVFSEEGPFGTAVFDPAWKVSGGRWSLEYPQMSIDEIHDFFQNKLRPRLLPDAHIFFWVIESYLPDAFKLLERWGIRYKFMMVWHKDGGYQPPGYPQNNCEFCICGSIGSPEFIDTTSFVTCFQAPRREHSRKPDEFYDTVRRVTAGPRVDVFSRERREGFAQYGNECDRFDAAPMLQAAE